MSDHLENFNPESNLDYEKMKYSKTVSERTFNEFRLAEFWWFVTERQKIWEARFRENLPFPWTRDSTLAKQHFTNVYRELDPGTKYAVDNILEVDAPLEDRFFNIMLYRLIGKEETHQLMGFQMLQEFNERSFENKLREIQSRGHPPFTAAYMVSGYRSMGSSNKITNVSRLFGRLASRFEPFFEQLIDAQDLESAHVIIRKQFGYGNFLAYQVLVDSTYPIKREGGAGLLHLSPNNWASAGPGAKKGIRIMSTDPSVTELQIMKWLRDNQRCELKRLNLSFPYLMDDNGKTIEISLSNIQNCLCEYYKYVKIKEGWGRGRRKFVPRSTRENLHYVQTELPLQ